MEKKIYPVITLYQPWAHWCSVGLKTIETRVHNRFACLKGKDILIHAGKTFDKDAYASASPYLWNLEHEEVVFGAILCKAHVSNFRQLNNDDSPSALIECNTLRYGLFLTELEPLEYPIPATGSMGIWYFDIESQTPVKKPNLQPSLF